MTSFRIAYDAGVKEKYSLYIGGLTTIADPLIIGVK